MKKSAPLIITISRQLGCGGAYIGRHLAKKLNIYYADREIIRKAASEFSLFKDEVEERDEKMLSFWQAFFQQSSYTPDIYTPPDLIPPTDRELFETEAEIIGKIAEKKSAVIIGRCGFHLLQDHPNHVSIFLHGNETARNKRIRMLHNISEEEAGRMIIKSDKERALYCKTFTEKDWADARNYDLCLNSSKMDIDASVDFILQYLKLL